MAETMSKTLYLRDIIKSTLQDVATVYENEAPEGASYPYVVFEVSGTAAEEYPCTGFVEINAWDRHPTFSRVDYIMDNIEKKLRHQFFKNDKIAFRTFEGDRGHVLDEDKMIKRTREKFLIRFNTRGE